MNREQLHRANMERVFDSEVKIPDFDSREYLVPILSTLSLTYSTAELNELVINIRSVRILKRILREFMSGLDYEGYPVSSIQDLLKISRRY